MHYTKEMLSQYFHIEPDGSIPGDVNYVHTIIKDITSLPDDLTVVRGDLDLSYTKVQYLPKNLRIEGRLDISNTPIKTLPEGLIVFGDLWASHSMLKSIQYDLKVGGSIYLDHTPIQTLPDKLTVGTNLYLYDTPIQALPNNLKVGWELDLHNTPIQCLPDNLIVGGNLYLNDTTIHELPETIKVGQTIFPDTLKLTPHQRLYQGVYLPGEYYSLKDDAVVFITGEEKIGEYTYYTGELPNKNIISDGAFYVICKNYESGVKEIRYQWVKYMGPSYYRSLYRNNELVSRDDMVHIYRLIIHTQCIDLNIKQQMSEISHRVVQTLMPDIDQCTIKEFIQRGQYYQSTHDRSLDGFDTFVSAI